MTSQGTQCEPVRPAASAAVVDEPSAADDGRSSGQARTHRFALPLSGRYLRRHGNLTELTGSVRSTARGDTEQAGMAP